MEKEPSTQEELERWASGGRDHEELYKQYLASLKREEHKINCNDCGCFVKKERWIPKTEGQNNPLCCSCESGCDYPDFI